jgi:hypothetical protein
MNDVKAADAVLPMTTYHVTIGGRLVIVTGRIAEAEAEAQARRMLAETDSVDPEASPVLVSAT